MYSLHICENKFLFNGVYILKKFVTVYIAKTDYISWLISISGNLENSIGFDMI